MLRYETLFLTVPEITSDESTTLEKYFDKTISESKGSTISYEKWGKFALAYPVRRYEYGVYYLIRFEVPEDRKDELLAALRTIFSVKYVDLIMRNVVRRLSSQGSLEYKRPESLEETPSKDIDTIMKESKSILGTSSNAPQEGSFEEEIE
jgi:ribosomal protein S6